MEKEDDKLFKLDICCFDFRSNFLGLVSILLNIGKERDIIVLISFPILFVSTPFSGKYSKRNVPSGFRSSTI